MGLFGGNKSENTTNLTDTSQNQTTTAQSGLSLQGNTIQGTVVNNDASIVGLGIQNNNIAASVLSHLTDVTGATIGKLADAVKSTSNDTLNAAVGNSAVQSQTASVFSGLANNIQNVVAVGAVLLGAWYFLKK